MAFPLGVVLLVAVLGTLRLNGSSLGLYGTSLGADEGVAGVLAGPVRGIRSDEWLVRTPWLLRQVELGLPERADGGVGTHDVTVLADLPTRGWELALRPHTASYLVLDEQRAFAVEWWLLAAVQLVGVYSLLYALTRRPAVSALAASLLALSPTTQWWWVPGAFTIIGYGCLATALLIFAHRASERRRKLAWSVAAGWALAAFLTTLYVPWQVGTAIVIAPVGIAALAPDVLRRETRRQALGSLAIVGAVTLGIAGLLFGSFVLVHREAIRTIAATEYPGKRPAQGGGGVNLAVLWGSAFDSFSAENPSATVNGTNQSENSSSLLYLLPVGLACFALGSAGRLRDHPLVPPLLACLAGGAVLLAWMVLPVPETLGRLVLLTRVPPYRLLLPFGFAGVLALGLLVGYQLDTGRHLGSVVLATSVAAFAAAQLWGASVYRVDDRPIDLSLAVVFIVVVSAGVGLAIAHRPVLGLGILTAFTLWQASLINPVQRGTDPLTTNSLRKAVDEIRRSAPAGTGWLAFGADPVVNGTMTASGVNYLSGVSPYPDRDAWDVLDPEGRHQNVWNRYAHLVFLPGTAGSPATFKLIGTDQFSVTVDPCSPALSELRVGYFVTQNNELSACSAIIRKVPMGAGHVMIYRRVPPK